MPVYLYERYTGIPVLTVYHVYWYKRYTGKNGMNGIPQETLYLMVEETDKIYCYTVQNI